jgi:transcription elongation factor Elf1
MMDEFRVCPQCGYERGFHVAFRKGKEAVEIFLICPNCGQSYELGWSTASIKSVRGLKGPTY